MQNLSPWPARTDGWAVLTCRAQIEVGQKGLETEWEKAAGRLPPADKHTPLRGETHVRSCMCARTRVRDHLCMVLFPR